MPQVVSNLEYASPATLLFQRLSVIATEGLLLFAAWHATRCCTCGGRPAAHSPCPCCAPAGPLLLFTAPPALRRRRPRSVRLAALFVAGANPGLLLVDHMHFQYNGMLLGG